MLKLKLLTALALCAALHLTQPADLCAQTVTAPPAANTFFTRYQARVTATQAEQPHWVTPLILVTPRLEQEFRTDFVHQYNTKDKPIWNYGNTKGLEFIPEKHTEILINLPPFFNRDNGASDGFGDIGFALKERLFSRNEEHGNEIVTFLLASTIPTGKNANGSCCAIVTPTLILGKGFGRFDVQTSAGGTLPVTNSNGLGHTITWNTVAQYRLASKGILRLFWPEIESNDSFYKGGTTDGKIASYVTPGIVFGRIPLIKSGPPASGHRGLGLTFGAGEEIAVTHYNTLNHATIITMRIPF
jgi:hypothetical protein